MILNKYKAITGSLPRRYEIAKWNEEHYLQYFEFVNFFTANGKLRVTNEGMVMWEKQVMEGTPSFKQEILFRINQFTSDPNASRQKFMVKLKTFTLNVGSFLKLYPSQVTTKMKEVMEQTPRLSWALSQYKTYETKIGVPIVVPDTIALVDAKERVHTPAVKDTQAKLMDAQVKLADIYLTLVNSVTQREIKNLPLKDRLAYIARLGPTVNLSTKVRPNVGVFQQITINKGNRDDLEKAILEFGEN